MLRNYVYANSKKEYNDHIFQLKNAGFKEDTTHLSSNKTVLRKVNLGPVIVPVTLVTSFLGSIIFNSSDISNTLLSFTNVISQIDGVKLHIAQSIMDIVGYVMALLFIVSFILLIYYFTTKPIEVVVVLNQEDNFLDDNQIRSQTLRSFNIR